MATQSPFPESLLQQIGLPQISPVFTQGGQEGQTGHSPVGTAKELLARMMARPTILASCILMDLVEALMCLQKKRTSTVTDWFIMKGGVY